VEGQESDFGIEREGGIGDVEVDEIQITRMLRVGGVCVMRFAFRLDTAKRKQEATAFALSMIAELFWWCCHTYLLLLEIKETLRSIEHRAIPENHNKRPWRRAQRSLFCSVCLPKAKRLFPAVAWRASQFAIYKPSKSLR